MYYSFWRTLWHGALRKNLSIPPGLYLLPFSSWYGASQPGYIIVPTLPSDLIYAVDSGAYRYTRSGHYPFEFADYLAWCQALNPAPQWVVIPDWFGGTTERQPTWQPVASHFHFLAALLSAKFHRLEMMHVQQLRTALMAYAVWDHFRDAVPCCWVPVLQGSGKVADYVWHARLMQPLIEEMAAHYGPNSQFRVGIGGVAGKSAAQVLEIVAAVAAVLPGYHFHLFGWKLQALQQMRVAFPTCIAGLSSDSSQWNSQRVRGKTPGKKAWQESGLTQLAYAYRIGLPSYEARLAQAWKQLEAQTPCPLPTLAFDPTFPEMLRVFLGMREFLKMEYRDAPYDLIDIRPMDNKQDEEEEEEELPPPDIEDLSTVYEIYHARQGVRFHEEPDLWYRERESFCLVALVRGSLDQLFERTNSIENLWTENAEVIWSRRKQLRSSSVGDVFVSCETGDAHMLANFGFIDLSSPTDNNATEQEGGGACISDQSSTILALTERSI